jgi:hypothetical protein
VAAATNAVAIVPLIGLINMVHAGSPNRSQKLIRLRVLVQLAVIVVILIKYSAQNPGTSGCPGFS